MRRAALLALLLAGCATRTHAYRFASPMLGAADVPPAPLATRGAPSPEPVRLANHAPHVTSARGVAGIEAAPPPIASAAAADAIAAQAEASGVVVPSNGVILSRLPAPNRLPSDAPLLAPQTGGRTCRCNTGPKCRHDHRLKQHPRWRVDQLPDGTFKWTTPSGRSYTTEPTRYPI